MEATSNSSLKAMRRFLKKSFIPHEENAYAPHALRPRMLTLYTFVVLLVKVVVVLSLTLIFPNSSTFAAIASQRIVDLTNTARVENGIAPLTVDQRLSASAEAKARDMLNREYFDHVEPSGQAPWHWFKEAGYIYTYAGENLGVHFNDADAIQKAWMDSETHRANILSDKFSNIGVAIVAGELDGKETIVVVEHFGKSFVGGTELASAGEASSATIASSPTEGVISGTSVRAEIKESGSFASTAIQFSRGFFMVLLAFLVVALALKILINIRVQHKHIIVYTSLLILLLVVMIIARFHWLEAIVETNTIL